MLFILLMIALLALLVIGPNLLEKHSVLKRDEIRSRNWENEDPLILVWQGDTSVPMLRLDLTEEKMKGRLREVAKNKKLNELKANYKQTHYIQPMTRTCYGCGETEVSIHKHKLVCKPVWEHYNEYA